MKRNLYQLVLKGRNATYKQPIYLTQSPELLDAVAAKAILSVIYEEYPILKIMIEDFHYQFESLKFIEEDE